MSNRSSMVPEAREALDRFKMEAANEVGVARTTKNISTPPPIYT